MTRILKGGSSSVMSRIGKKPAEQGQDGRSVSASHHNDTALKPRNGVRKVIDRVLHRNPRLSAAIDLQSQANQPKGLQLRPALAGPRWGTAAEYRVGLDEARRAAATATNDKSKAQALRAMMGQAVSLGFMDEQDVRSVLPEFTAAVAELDHEQQSMVLRDAVSHVGDHEFLKALLGHASAPGTVLALPAQLQVPVLQDAMRQHRFKFRTTPGEQRGTIAAAILALPDGVGTELKKVVANEPLKVGAATANAVGEDGGMRAARDNDPSARDPRVVSSSGTAVAGHEAPVMAGPSKTRPAP